MVKSKIPIEIMFIDFDGTLVNSLPIAIKIMQKVQSELGLKVKTEEEISKSIGYGENYFLKGATGYSDGDNFLRAKSTYYNLYRQEGVKITPLFPNIREFLSLYKDKHKVILSNKKSEFIRLITDNLNITGYFAELIGSDNIECMKPDPCGIIKLLEKYGIPKEKALMIGDMVVDIETGKNADIKTCALAWGLDPKQKLIQAHPDILIEDILELSRYIC
jgi:phosphoglycolate phosphatase